MCEIAGKIKGIINCLIILVSIDDVYVSSENKALGVGIGIGIPILIILGFISLFICNHFWKKRIEDLK